MHPVLVSFGQLHIFSYGVMVAVGAALATYLMCRESKTIGVDADVVIDLAVWTLLGGILGGRLLYVFVNLPYYEAHLLEIVDITKGGLIWYGGFIGGLVSVCAFALTRGIPLLRMTDFMVAFVALAQACGRIGCFMNGCCYGVPVSPGIPGIVFPGSETALCPTQLYSSAALLMIYAILRVVQKRPHRTGMVTVAYLLLYGMKRFAMEFMRGDNPKIFMGLTLAQIMSVAMVCAACVATFFLTGRERGKRV